MAPTAVSADAMPAALLRVDGLHFAVGSRSLFDNWSCRVAPGVTVVQGGEGTGKTSLLRLLAGELPATGGVLRIGDAELGRDADGYRQQVFLADARSDAFDQITPLAYLATLQARYPGFDGKDVQALIDGLSLSEHRDKPLYMLSTGSRRKVWFMGAVTCGAPLTLLDDPFAALDRRSIGFVCEVLRQAATHPARAWVLADYAPPPGVPLAGSIDLG